MGLKRVSAKGICVLIVQKDPRAGAHPAESEHVDVILDTYVATWLETVCVCVRLRTDYKYRRSI